jgi:hypothetical protein
MELIPMDEKLFTQRDLSPDNPPGICSECAAYGIEHISSGVLACYCRHRATGIWRTPGGIWDVVQPASFDAFQRALLAVFLEFDFQERQRKAAAH